MSDVWNEQLDKKLRTIIENMEYKKWEIASKNLNIPPKLCQSRYNNLVSSKEKKPSKKSPWTDEEDKILMSVVEKYGPANWSELAKHLAGRNGKQCRERWYNCLDPNIKSGPWAQEEDELIIRSVQEIGTKWSEIAKKLPGRTSNAIKNHWNASLKAKYSGPSIPKEKTFWNEANPLLTKPIPQQRKRKYDLTESSLLQSIPNLQISKLSKVSNLVRSPNPKRDDDIPSFIPSPIESSVTSSPVSSPTGLSPVVENDPPTSLLPEELFATDFLFPQDGDMEEFQSPEGLDFNLFSLGFGEPTDPSNFRGECGFGDIQGINMTR